ncbi:MAG: hypothetical protein ABMA02_18955 [Saprospiraceae bacterium]
MRYFVLLAFAALLFTACQKEEYWDWPFFEVWKGDQTHGKVTAIRNGQSWEGSAVAYFFNIDNPDRFDLSFSGFFPDGILAENMDISNIPKSVGSYTIYNSQGLSGTWGEDSTSCKFDLIEDDIRLTDGYFPVAWSHSLRPPLSQNQSSLGAPLQFLEIHTNRIWVDAIDTIVGTVSGRFEVTVEKGQDESKFPKRFRFKNGAFTARRW